MRVSWTKQWVHGGCVGYLLWSVRVQLQHRPGASREAPVERREERLGIGGMIAGRRRVRCVVSESSRWGVMGC